MNRPIKYRAWANGKMHDVRAISFTESGKVHRILDTEGVQRVPEALLQFTGLHDKNGERIWDGDILWVPDTYTDVIVEGRGPREPDNHLLPVEFRCGEFGIEVQDNKDVLSKGWRSLSFLIEEIGIGETEVVGNVYENPELLAKQRTMESKPNTQCTSACGNDHDCPHEEEANDNQTV